MNRNKKSMTAVIPPFAASLMGVLCLGFAGPLLAAAPTAESAAASSPSANPSAANSQSAQKCMNDLRAFDDQMLKQGNWHHGSTLGFGYGYPVYGYGHGYGYGYGYGEHGSLVGHGNTVGNSHSRARPGYEVRTLVASATILAQRGQQAECDALLTVARDVYKGYAADLRDSSASRSDGLAWRTKQIAAALPVVRSKAGYRSDQLIGADVVDPQGNGLGDVYDVVMNPQTGKITYLVVGRGGVFGIGENHVPVPWEAFKMTADSNTMVLDSTKSNLDDAPRVAESHFSPRGDVGQQGPSADAFWKSHILK